MLVGNLNLRIPKRSAIDSSVGRSTVLRPPGGFVVLALGTVAALGLLVFVGRWEGRHHAHSELAGMRTLLALVGPLDNSTLTAYRIDVDSRFDCLIYKRGTNRLALELCFDRTGRLVETIDRRSGSPKIASLREDPSASTIHVDWAEVVKLLKRLGAPFT
jgi:hypothetical protein